MNYSFCSFNIPEEGGRVLWQITNSCNYSCGYCIFSSGPGKIQGELDAEEAAIVLGDLHKRNFKSIKFTGGEPFYKRDIMQIVESAMSLGMKVDISTNASMISRKKASDLAALKIPRINVSIDGHTKEVHEKARGKNTFAPTIQGVQNLVQEGVYIRIGTAIFGSNEYLIKEMIDYYTKLGAKEIAFSLMEPVGRMRENAAILARRNRQELSEEIMALAATSSIRVTHNFYIPQEGLAGVCPAVTKFLYIDHLGRVSPCTWIVDKDSSYRSELSLKKYRLEEILASAPLKQYLAWIESSGKKGCPLHWREK